MCSLCEILSSYIRFLHVFARMLLCLKRIYKSKEEEGKYNNYICISVCVFSQHKEKLFHKGSLIGWPSRDLTGWHLLGECTKIQDLGLRFFKSRNFILSMAQSWLRETKYYLNLREIRRRQWHPTPVLLPGKSHGWRSLVGCSPWGHEESDTTERLHFHFTFVHWRRKWQPTPVFLPGESQGRGAWWAAVYGVTQSRTWLKRLSRLSSSSERDSYELLLWSHG